jgi:hypothetical protein
MNECISCHKSVPNEQFDQESRLCQICHDSQVLAVNHGRHTPKVRTQDQIVDIVLHEAQHVPDGLRDAQDMMSCIVQELGGFQTLARQYREQLEVAQANSPGSARVLDAFHRIVKLQLEVCRLHNERNDQVDRLSDDSLRETLVSAFVKVRQQLENDNGNQPAHQ